MACTRSSTRSSTSSSTKTHGHGGGHGKPITERNNRKVALLIAVIALFLAFSETLGKSAQTAALSYNVEASNLWAFYQAKTIRQTALQAAGELLKYDRMKIDRRNVALTPSRRRWPNGSTPGRRRSRATRPSQRQREVRKEADLNPPYGEGRRELMALALAAERKRDTAMERYRPLRGGVGGVPDRHRARLGGGHHRHDRADLAERGRWARR